MAIISAERAASIGSRKMRCRSAAVLARNDAPMPAIVNARLLTRNRRARASPGQRLLHERQALPDLFDRRPGAAILVFDVSDDRPSLLLQHLQHRRNRRVALAPRHVVALISPPILEVQVADVGVVLAEIRDRVEVGRGEVTDVQIHLEVLRQLHCRGEAVGRGEFVGIVGVRVAVHRDDHLVLARRMGRRAAPRESSSTP